MGHHNGADDTMALVPRLELHLGGRIDGAAKQNVLAFRTQGILKMHVRYFSIANDPAYQ